jgi:hypothetical protein
MAQRDLSYYNLKTRLLKATLPEDRVPDNKELFRQLYDSRFSDICVKLMLANEDEDRMDVVNLLFDYKE